MSLHHDPVVDKAMRAVIASGSHFWDPDSQRFHKSKPVCGVMSESSPHAFIVERYRRVYMGARIVQHPHSRVLKVQLQTGDIEYLAEDGSETGLMATHYNTNAQALKAAKRFAGVTP